MTPFLPKILLSAGEPAGIGPDLCVMLAQQKLDAELVVISNAAMLEARADMLNLPLHTQSYAAHQPKRHFGNGSLTVWDQALPETADPGVLNAKNSPYVLECLRSGTLACLKHEFDALVTAPVHKGIINAAGIVFSGHTEFLAELSHVPQVVMMLVGGGMRVALATTHLALKDVPAAITQTSLEACLRILHEDLIAKFAIAQPRILVAGLNPHAGEDGYLGREEIEIINPVLAKLRSEGMQLIGALPADTLFSPGNLQQADAVLAMYHDQGLPVLKHASFGNGVNVTLGLPIIRTSVDHGTALTLAGAGLIKIGSLLAAIDLAIELSHQREALQQ
ncbi:PdxA Pyridoxal phosphate biosynthesis protein [Methylophilaceae bacterium]